MTSTDQPTAFANLQEAQYANLTTFRKSGEAVVTPVWFAQRGDKLYIITTPDTGKVKRIRNNGNVEIGPCARDGKPLGPSVEATARIVPPELEKQANEALNQKYGLIKSAFDFGMTVRRTKRAWLEVTPR